MKKCLQPNKPQSPNEKNPIVLLATKINSVNAKIYNQFVCVMQFNIKELETYIQAIQRPNTI